MSRRNKKLKSSNRAPTSNTSTTDRFDVVKEAREIRQSLMNALQSQGDTGLVRFGQYIYDEWHKQLVGSKAAKMWREIKDNDPIVGLSLWYYEMLIRQMDWTWKAADDSPEAQYWATFATECMNDMDHSWGNFISQALSFIPFGYDLHEEIYKKRLGESDLDNGHHRSKYDDGLIGWKCLSPRSQETNDGWLFDPDNGRVLGMYQQPPYGSRKLIYLNKCFHIVYRSENDNPEGVSAFRSLFTSYMAVKTLRWIEGVGFERNVGGMPIMYAPIEAFASTDPDDIATLNFLRDIVTRLKRDEQEGIVMPSPFNADGSNSGYGLESFNSNQAAAMASLDTVIKRYEQKISMCLGTEFALLGSNEHGSYNMHDDKTNHLAMRMDSIADLIETGFNSQTARRLFDYNGVPVELRPRLEHGDIKKRSLLEFASAISQLFNVGMFTPTPQDEEYARRLGGMPIKQEAI